MELHQLRYVIQVAKHLNFSKAASKLNVTQPTLSHQILKLEMEIGVSLFERKTRSVKPTFAGEEFVAHAEKVLAELEALHDVMQQHRSSRTGEIRIGTLPYTSNRGLIPYIPSFKESYAGIRIRIIEVGGSQDLVKLLLAGDVDVAYIIPQPDWDYGAELDFYPLFKGKVVLLTGKNHRFAKRNQISLSEASEELFILPPSTHSMYNAALAACRIGGFEPKVACECSHLNTLFTLVAKGPGIAFVSSQFVESSLPSGIKVISFEPVIERTICLAVLKDKHQLPVISVFRDFMLRAINCG